MTAMVMVGRAYPRAVIPPTEERPSMTDHEQKFSASKRRRFIAQGVSPGYVETYRRSPVWATLVQALIQATA